MPKLMPKRIKVGGLIYTIEFKENLFETNDVLLGMHDLAHTLIKITKTYIGNKLSWGKIHEILLHELFHAIDEMYAVGVAIDHSSLNQLAIGWYQVLLDNNLNLTGSSMPKFIKVGGLKYKLEYPYIFENEPKLVFGTQHNEETLLCLGATNEEGAYNTAFINQNLVELINHSIAQVYIGEWDNNDFSMKLNRMSRGIFQVITDNNLEELIKNGAKEDKLRGR